MPSPRRSLFITKRNICSPLISGSRAHRPRCFTFQLWIKSLRSLRRRGGSRWKLSWLSLNKNQIPTLQVARKLKKPNPLREAINLHLLLLGVKNKSKLLRNLLLEGRSALHLKTASSTSSPEYSWAKKDHLNWRATKSKQSRRSCDTSTKTTCTYILRRNSKPSIRSMKT